MSRLLAIILVSLGLTVVAAGQRKTRSPRPKPTPTPTKTSDLKKAEWVTFTSELGGFSILMPEIPTNKTEIIESEPGPYTTHVFKAHDTKNIYVIAWVDYDPNFNFHKQTEMYANRDYVVRDMKAKLLSSRLVRIDGYQTLEFTAETSSRILKSRVFVVGRRPFQITISLPKDQDDQPTVSRFFNSLKFRPSSTELATPR